MCGISLSKDFSRAVEMAEKISHRGEKIKTERTNWGSVSHNRLAIQGLEEEFDCPYPLTNHRNGKNLLFNGEVFNYKQIDPKFRSDVEVFNSKENLIRRSQVDGDYAVVIYDYDGNIELATDPLGKRQLYYRLEENGTISEICSEIKGLLRPNDKIDDYYLSTVNRFGYFFGQDQTLVKGIRRFQPGKIYFFTMGKEFDPRIEKILWNKIETSNVSLSEKIRYLMETAVSNRLVSDVPIAVLFSGGIDSSILLYHLKNLGADLELFTIFNSDDKEYAQKYAKELGFKLNYFEKPEDETQNGNKKWNELGADLGSFNLNYFLFQEIKKAGYKVCLTADGADEVFSGYKRNKEFDHQQNDVFNEMVYYHLPRLDRTAMIHTVEYRSPYTAEYVVDLGLSIPYYERINKRALREAYRGLIPDYILDREKTPLKEEKIKKDPKEQRVELCKWMEKNFIKEWTDQ